MMHKISFTDEHGTYTVERDYSERMPGLDNIISELVVPVLTAAGYHSDVIRKFIDC